MTGLGETQKEVGMKCWYDSSWMIVYEDFSFKLTCT